MSSVTTEPRTVTACPHCQVGTLSLQRVVYARWYAGHFVTIPNFPSWVCDVCGHLEYDSAALEQVRMILGRESGETPETASRPGRPQAPLYSQPRPSGRRPI